MPRNYYIFTPGKLRRRQNTLYFEPSARPGLEPETDPAEIDLMDDDFESITNERGNTVRKPIPIEDIAAFYCFGEITFNSKFLNFAAQYHIPIHIFNYYGFYSATFYPREYLNSGFLTLHQAAAYLDNQRRLSIARELVQATADNLLRNLKYYRSRGKDVEAWVDTIEGEMPAIAGTTTIPELMGTEGRIRQAYFQSFSDILKDEIEFGKRVRRPPNNIINALISFNNSLVYTSVLGELYRTQLNPTLSFLHEPGERRFSLSLDLAEIFKPILADRMLFKLLNKRMLTEKHFEARLNYCYLNEKGRKIVVREYDERLKTTIRHRTLRRNVSYRRLIRLECYKLIKHLTEGKKYKAFRAWW